MALETLPEYWLRGPVPNVPPLLQPVAHALLQARQEVTQLMQDFDDRLLWLRPAGVASIGFHLQHLSGVIDRLFTYANGQSLTSDQRRYLTEEGNETKPGISTQALVQAFQQQVSKALEQLGNTDETSIVHVREVGRARLPSTVLGLLMHAAEHTMRHTGQLLVTVRILQAGYTA